MKIGKKRITSFLYLHIRSFSILIIISALTTILSGYGHKLQLRNICLQSMESVAPPTVLNKEMEQYSYTREIRLAPGEYYAAWYDGKRHQFVEDEPDRGYSGLDKEAQLQILRAPMWLREELADRLVDLYYDDIDVGKDAAPVFHDINSDGLDDLIVGNAEGSLKCFLAPYFKEDTKRFGHIRVSSNAVSCFFDIDGDGKVELVVGDAVGGLSVWEGEDWKQPGEFGSLPFSGQVHPVAVPGNGLFVGDTTGQVWKLVRGRRFKKLREVESGDNGSFTTPISAHGRRLQLQGSKEGKIFTTSTGISNEEFIENIKRIKVAGNSCPVFHDMNHDGILDLVVGSADGTISVFVNYGSKGMPWFTTYSSKYKKKFDTDVGYLSSPRIADLNSDGIPDMVSGAKDGMVRFFPGPTFKKQSDFLRALHFEGVVVPAPGDFNGDGKVDIAVGFEDGVVRFFAGSEFLEDEVLSESVKVASYAAPYAVDFDHDGKLDLMVGSGDGRIHFFRDTGDGFKEIPDFFGELETGEYPSPAALDVNGDGFLDLVVGNKAGEIKVFLAPDWTEFPEGLSISKIEGFAALGFGDLTGDAQPELVVGELNGTFTYFEKETGGWIEKHSWQFEPSMGLKEVADYFSRCHPESELLRGMIDTEVLNSFVKVLASAEDKYFDEVAFALANTPTEVLRAMARVDNADILLENAKCIYNMAAEVKYAKIIEKEDYTTLEYAGERRKHTELPRDIYYWWVVHPRLYYEVPLRVDASYWEQDAEYYGVTEEQWTRKKIDLENIGTCSKCEFWRTYLVKNKKYSKTLQEVVAPAKTMKEAIYLLGDWISQSMPESWYTYGRKSADLQPNVIYQKNYGSCGESAILCAAFARTMLIPISCTGCGGEDHVWNEFWDEEKWYAWDVGGPSFRIRYPWASCEGVEHKGGQVLAVTRHRGDDCVDARTTEVSQPLGCNYTPTGKGYTEVGHVTVKAVDAAGEPIEGAAVVVRSNAVGYWRTSIWGYTDPDGICYFELGRPRRSCLLDVITQQGITGTSNFLVRENREYHLKYVVPGRFKRQVLSWQQTSLPMKTDNAGNVLIVATRVLSEEQRPRNLATARREPSEMTDFIKKTRYTGTRWHQYFNRFKRGIALCRLSREEFESFKETGVLPVTTKVIDTIMSYSFDPESDDIYFYYNTNRYTYVRFKATFTARMPQTNPEIELTEVPKRAKTGGKVSFAGRASDNLYVAALKVSIDGGSNWIDITNTLDRKTDTFTYVWNTGQGGPLASGKYPVVFRVEDSSGGYQQTDTIEVILDNTREFHDQIIYQDDPDSPLPVSSWILGPFEVTENERFLGITSFSEDSEFDMDMFLFYDKNGNRKLDGIEEQQIKSTTPTAIEKIVLQTPPEGVYWIYCQGWQVKPRKDDASKSNDLDEFPPGRFLALDRDYYEKKTTYAHLDVSLSFDYKLTSIVDIEPVGEVPVDDVLVKGKFEPNGRIDPASVRITLDDKDITDKATIDEEGFELKLLDAELNHDYTVNIEARTCYGDIDYAEWKFKTVFLPINIEKELVPDKKALKVTVQPRKDFKLRWARARFWNIKKEEKKSEWFDLKLSKNGKSASDKLSVDGWEKGSYTLEVKYRIAGDKVKSKELPFKLEEGYAEPRDIAIYPNNESKVYDFRPVLAAYVIGEYKEKTKSIKFIFDGVDITDKCKVYETKIKYFPIENLNLGKHTLECIVTLRNNTALKNKSTFTIKMMGEKGEEE